MDLELLELVFKLANGFTMLCWLLLLLFPRTALTRHALYTGYTILLLAVAYCIILGFSFGKAQGDFSSLAGVMSLFTNPVMTLAGWIHYLAFDLFVGITLQKEFARSGTRQFVRIPILVATFMFGPSGYLLFFLTQRRAPDWSMAGKAA